MTPLSAYVHCGGLYCRSGAGTPLTRDCQRRLKVGQAVTFRRLGAPLRFPPIGGNQLWRTVDGDPVFGDELLLERGNPSLERGELGVALCLVQTVRPFKVQNVLS